MSNTPDFITLEYSTSTGTTVEITTKSASPGVSLGLVLPIVLIGVFLIIVASCLYWHSWRDKRQSSGNAVIRSRFSLKRLSSNLRSGNEWTKDHRSCSTSDTPIKRNLKDHYRLPPTTWHQGTDTTSTSNFLRNIVHGSSIGAIDNPAFQSIPRRLSPINETETSRQHVSSMPSGSRSFHAGTVATDYHTVWINGEWERSSSLPNFHSNVTRDETSYDNKNPSPAPAHHDGASTDKLHINLNSPPIRGLNSSRVPVANVIENHYVNTAEEGGSSATVYPESANRSSSLVVAPNQRSRSSDISVNVSSSLSLPSSISKWHQRNVHCDWDNVKFGQVQVGPAIPNQVLASSIDSYTSSENVSMQPNIGSSTNTSGLVKRPQVSSVNSSNTNSRRPVLSVPNNTAASSAVLAPTVPHSDELTDGTSSMSNVNRSECLIHGHNTDISLIKQTTFNRYLQRSFSTTAHKNVNRNSFDGGSGDILIRDRLPSYPVDPAIPVNTDGQPTHSLTHPNYLHHVTAPDLPPLILNKQYWV